MDNGPRNVLPLCTGNSARSILAEGEVCPVWPCQPITAHWGFPDPARVEGDDERKRFAVSQVAHQLRTRINLFLSLPHDKLDRMALEHAVSGLAPRPAANNLPA